MAMVVKNNVAAQLALGELRKNNDKLSKNLKQVASGMKLNGAGDGASEYAISEKMRVRIRALGQCDDNTKTGHSMLAQASQAVDEQVQVMQKLRMNALKASDDTYSQKDRDVLQNEANHLLDQLEEIGTQTEYNGRYLLNGTENASPKLAFDFSAPEHPNKLPLVSTTKTVQSFGNITAYDLECYQPIGNQTLYDVSAMTWQPMSVNFANMTAGMTVHDQNGTAYTTIVDTVSNALGVQTAGGQFQPIVDSAGNDSNGQSVTGGFTPCEQVCPAYSGTPAKGASIAFNAAGSPVYTYDIEAVSGNPIAVPVNPANGGSRNSYDFSFAGFSGAIPTDLDQEGVSLLCTACKQFISIIFDAKAPSGSLNEILPAGNASNGTIALLVGVSGAKTADDVSAAVWDALSAKYKTTKLTPAGESVQLPANGAGHEVTLERYPSQPTGYRYLLARNDASQSSHLCLYDGVKGEIKDIAGKKPQQTLYIQGATTGSAETAIRLPNTTLAALFPTEGTVLELDPQEADYPTQWSSDYAGCTSEAARRAKWRDECWPYPKAGAHADGSCLRTRKQAERFLDDIDQAMKYLLASNTTLGAQVQRMEIMEKNIVTSQGNTQASESVIRDADMAKAMTDYVKSNVLSQSASAMLAQANQHASRVMSLLQS